jgi:hypothetical protein
MNQFLEKTRNSLIEHTLMWLLPIVGGILLALSYSFHDGLLSLVLEKKAESLLVWFAFGLTIVLLLLLMSLLYLLLYKYKLKPAFGMLWDKEYNSYCPVCKVLMSNYFDQQGYLVTFSCPECNTEFLPYHSKGLRLSYDEIIKTFKQKYEK